jgi:transcriptional regulator with XRE-family HTH domain
MTLREYRESLGWSQAELARRAGLDVQTARRAEEGEQIQGRTAISIAQALSDALGRTINIKDIDGLNVRV